MERSKYIFKCGDMNIELTNDYAYLGLILSEFLDFNLTAKIVAKSANRALGLVMAKCKTIGGVSYDVYKKLFDSHNLSNRFCRSLSVSANNTMSYAYSNIQAFSPPISIPKSNDFK
jgi:hypothetical protein